MPLPPISRTDDGSNGGVHTFWQSMDGIVTFANTMEANLIALTATVTALAAVVSGLGGKISSVESSVSALSSQVKTLQDKVSPISSGPTGPGSDTNSGTQPTHTQKKFAP